MVRSGCFCVGHRMSGAYDDATQREVTNAVLRKASHITQAGAVHLFANAIGSIDRTRKRLMARRSVAAAEALSLSPHRVCRCQAPALCSHFSRGQRPFHVGRAWPDCAGTSVASLLLLTTTNGAAAAVTTLPYSSLKPHFNTIPPLVRVRLVQVRLPPPLTPQLESGLSAHGRLVETPPRRTAPPPDFLVV